IMDDDTTTVFLGRTCLVFKSPDLEELEDCNDILDNRQLLMDRLQDKGYLFIRQLHDRNEVLQARQAVLEYLYQEKPSSFDPSKPLEEGVLSDASKPLTRMEVSDTMMNDTMNGTMMNDTMMNDTMNDTMMNDTMMNDTMMNDTIMNDMMMNDTMMNRTR
ncbi:hypothetical protein QZH41_008340, partial [Actinostola sp. cb2023]